MCFKNVLNWYEINVTIQRILMGLKISNNITFLYAKCNFIFLSLMNMFLTGFSHFVKIGCSFCSFIINTAGFFPGSSEGSNRGDSTRHTFPKLFMAHFENVLKKRPFDNFLSKVAHYKDAVKLETDWMFASDNIWIWFHLVAWSKWYLCAPV